MSRLARQEVCLALAGGWPFLCSYLYSLTFRALDIEARELFPLWVLAEGAGLFLFVRWWRQLADDRRVVSTAISLSAYLFLWALSFGFLLILARNYLE